MKRIMMAMACAMLTAWAAGDTLPRDQWLAKVGDSAQNPAVLKETIGQLSAADQTAFLAEVNAAIAKMPGSDEVRAAKFVDANRAAVSGATKENRSAVLAEVFATVPPEYLTVINENFASDLFNRNANPSRPFTDEEFMELSTNTMATITARCATAENAAVRGAFAALMFERASGGSPAGLRDALIATLPAGSQETAKSEWFPAAMGEGREKTYDPMLGVSEAGEEPNHAVVLQLTAPQNGQALLADLQRDGTGATTASAGMASGAFFNAPGIVGATEQPDTGMTRVPRPAVLSSTPLGLSPVKDAMGNVMRDEDGRQMFYGPNGSIVYSTVDQHGRTVYVDSEGNLVVNPISGGTRRGDNGGGIGYVVIPEGGGSGGGGGGGGGPEPVPYP